MPNARGRMHVTDADNSPLPQGQLAVAAALDRTLVRRQGTLTPSSGLVPTCGTCRYPHYGGGVAPVAIDVTGEAVSAHVKPALPADQRSDDDDQNCSGQPCHERPVLLAVAGSGSGTPGSARVAGTWQRRGSKTKYAGAVDRGRSGSEAVGM